MYEAKISVTGTAPDLQPRRAASCRRTSRAAAALVLVLSAVVGIGCSSGPFAKWIGGTKSSKAGEQTFYAGAAGMKVYEGATASSKTVGELTLHQKVTRFRVDNGYAYIETDKGLKGWVVNARLLWRLPAATTAGAGDGQAQQQPAHGAEQSPEPQPGSAQEEPAAAQEEDAAAAGQSEVAPDQQQGAETPPAPATQESVPAAPAQPSTAKPTDAVAPSVFDPY